MYTPVTLNNGSLATDKTESAASGTTSSVRAGDRVSVEHARTDRLFSKSGLWYFRTREGKDVGPFRYRTEAELMLTRFIQDLAAQQQPVSTKPHFRISAQLGRQSR
ncbi:DUF6316 family protein [Pseudohongiella sp. SYSU M77423]|uniref:DUF6316 family protein n=1 Tax=Pseudohongiella sp. SYSU M77423 TaxID=3042312 RepID=UPI000E9DBFFB|nr:DUF6316 family protein [Pseudohongiella sp. SYSU M77423]MDH7943221.1 DUF6316 family protein [Pseudohongiella sp. SYSU M77423]MEC8860945.1 DUF6316 family protein [Pseudomonadota bacterium]HBX35823.1 hypothetical protein [Pseudohongiella sp.]|tara:strand:+ start:120289 stop:120606 length:318 start_codon:yes stop_codon:yes gene_type:complete